MPDMILVKFEMLNLDPSLTNSSLKPASVISLENCSPAKDSKPIIYIYAGTRLKNVHMHRTSIPLHIDTC